MLRKLARYLVDFIFFIYIIVISITLVVYKIIKFPFDVIECVLRLSLGFVYEDNELDEQVPSDESSEESSEGVESTSDTSNGTK